MQKLAGSWVDLGGNLHPRGDLGPRETEKGSRSGLSGIRPKVRVGLAERTS